MSGFPRTCIACVIPDTVAAAVAYFNAKHMSPVVPGQEVREVLLVSHLGGGFYGASLLEVHLRFIDPSGRGTLFMDVIASEGDSNVGGVDFTHSLADLILSKFQLAGLSGRVLASHFLEHAETMKHAICLTENETVQYSRAGVSISVSETEYIQQVQPLTEW